MDLLSSYPRVLVVSGEPFNRESATGITISNLFEGWPKERIAQIYSARIEPDTSVCSSYWKMSVSDQSLVGPVVRRLASWRQRRPGASGVASTAGRLTSTSRRARLGAVQNVSLLLDLAPYQLSGAVRDGVERFRPQVIYSLLGNMRIVRLVRDLSGKYDIPVVPHFMDDWLSTYTSSHPVPGLTNVLQKRLSRMTHQLMGSCHNALGISAVMCEEYAERFGCLFSAIMNPVELPPTRTGSRSLDDPFRLVYVGGLHLGRAKCIEDIAQAVSCLRAKSVPIELHIFAPDAQGAELAHATRSVSGCLVHSSIEASVVQSELSRYDAAVHVESFDAFYSGYTRLSISTKIPQYLAASLPVLVYSPAAAASTRYLMDSDCGVAVVRRDAADLESALLKLVSHTELHLKLASNARRNAEAHHDAKIVRAQLVQALSLAVKRGIRKSQ